MNKLANLRWALMWLASAPALYAAGPGTPSTPAPAAAAPTAKTPQAEVQSFRTYNYMGDRYRDPFISLLGEVSHYDSATDAAPPPISSLSLKGIVEDAHGRVALLNSGAASYVLRAGRLYDGRNRMVKKISGVVKADSVVIIGADRTVRELRVKNTL